MPVTHSFVGVQYHTRSQTYPMSGLRSVHVHRVAETGTAASPQSR